MRGRRPERSWGREFLFSTASCPPSLAVVGMAAKQADGPVELLRNDDADDSVRQC